MKKLQTPFEEKTWPHYKEIIVDKINKYYKEQIWTKQGKEVQAIIDACQAAHDNYKKGFNWALYYTLAATSPLGVLLVVPAYWQIKKLKKMTAEKKNLKMILDEKDKLRLENIKSIIHKINFCDIINECFLEIQYEHKGPLPPHFLKILRKHYPQFENDWIINSIHQNANTSSWGVFNEHTLILNVAKKLHWIENKPYSATRSYPYTTKGIDGKTTTNYETLTAIHHEPFPMYQKEYTPSAFSLRSENLKFRSVFNEKEKHLMKAKDGMMYAPLENKMFNKEFPIIRNDEVGLRVYYTADVQEYFVNTLKDYNNDGKNLPYYYWWFKNGPFISSSFQMTTAFYGFREEDYTFIKDVKLELENILNKCTEIMLKIIFERFLSLNCASVLPCVLTEYQNQLIHELDEASKKTIAITPEDDIYAQGVMNTIWNQPVIKSDTDTMHVMHTVKKEYVNKLIVSKVQIETNGFKAVNRIASVWVQGFRTGAHLIQVPYVEYIPLCVPLHLYYTQFKCFGIFENNTSDIGELADVIRKYGMQERVKIKDDHVVYVYRDDSGYEKFKELLQEIDKHFANKQKSSAKNKQ